MAIPKRFSTGVQYKSASEYNSRIDFAQAVGAEADGTLNPPTIVKCGVWASIAVWRGKESDTAQQRNALSSVKITVRYDKQFQPTADMLIFHNGQTYNIETVTDIDGQRIQLELWAWTENGGVTA